MLHWTLDTTDKRTYSLDLAPRPTIQGFSCFRSTADDFYLVAYDVGHKVEMGV